MVSSNYSKSSVYNSHNKDVDAIKFYKTKAWKLKRQEILTRDYGMCQECLRHGVFTRDLKSYSYLTKEQLEIYLNADDQKRKMYVHHKIPLKEAPELALDSDNLETLCSMCHSEAHPEKYGKMSLTKIEKVKSSANVINNGYQREL